MRGRSPSRPTSRTRRPSPAWPVPPAVKAAGSGPPAETHPATGARFRGCMRMRQSLAEIEATIFEAYEEEQQRAERQRVEAERRTRRRHAIKAHKRGSMRFGLLVTILIATAVIVTIVMFQALYYLLG